MVFSFLLDKFPYFMPWTEDFWPNFVKIGRERKETAMWKVQLFVFVETVLVSMALVTMLAADFSRVVII